MASKSENLRGAGYMAMGMASFTLSDTAMKVLGSRLPLDQILVMRGIGTCSLMLIACLALRQFRLDFSKRDWVFLILRAIGEVGCAYLFLTALFNMPYADANAILQCTPLAVMLMAAFVFGEKLTPKRLMAILVGFVGVMIIIRPGGEGFSVYSLLVLATVVSACLRDLSARQISREVPALMSTIIGGLAVLASGLLMGAVRHVEWVPLTGLNWAGLMLAIFGITGGYLGVLNASRTGDLGFVAPFRYSSLVMSAIAGLVIFGVLPDGWTILGAAIVVSTGIYTIFEERRRA